MRVRDLLEGEGLRIYSLHRVLFHSQLYDSFDQPVGDRSPPEAAMFLTAS
jgi:hypothetical protein